MAPRGNNVIAKPHYRKHYTYRVRTYFDGPMKKKKRRTVRDAKAAKVFPRPLGLLRPIVHCPTLRYNRKLREGRGFSLEELKRAKISSKIAPTIGICVDKRRQNKSHEAMEVNIQRLKEYMSKLVLLPRVNKVNKNLSGAEKAKAIVEQKERKEDLKEKIANAVQNRDQYIIPISDEKKELNVEFYDIKQKEKDFKCYESCQIAKERLRISNRKRAKEEEAKK